MEHPLKILIITHFFPPQNEIAAQRPLSWAKYWSQIGHNVDVLTTPKDKYGHIDQNSPYNIHVVEISPIYRKLQKWYHQSFKKQSNQTGPKALSDKSISAKIKKWLFQKGLSTSTRMPDPTDLWVSNAKRWVKDQNKNWDIVVSTYGPYSTHLIGHYVRTQYFAKIWCADFRDYWTDNEIYPGFPILSQIEKIMEKFLLKDADFISLDSPAKVEFFKHKYKRDILLVSNGFDPDEFESLDKRNIFEDGKKVISYTGSIYPGLRDPQPFFNELRQLKKSGQDIDFEVHFYGQNVDVLESLIEDIRDIVKIKGMVSRKKALQIQRDSHLLLYLENEKNNIDGIIPGKLYEYIYSGTPILAVGITPKGNAGSLIKENGGYFSFLDIHEWGSKVKPSEKVMSFSRKKIADQFLRELTLNQTTGDIIKYFT